MVDKTKLELRRTMKKKMPSFLRQDAHKMDRLKQNWRKPKGSNSKMRQHLKGYRVMVKPGYGSPVEVKGLSREGFIPVKVATIDELKKINKETQAVIVCGKIGTKKRIALIKKSEELGLKILNFKDPKDYLHKKEEEINKKKDFKKKRSENKEKKKKEKQKKESKKDLADKIEKFDETEKKEQEKIEKDKLLTRKAS